MGKREREIAGCDYFSFATTGYAAASPLLESDIEEKIVSLFWNPPSTSVLEIHVHVCLFPGNQ